MLTKVAALENARNNIRVNAIAPGPIDTPLLRKALPDKKAWKQSERNNPMGRIGTPQEVAQLALFLASDDASYVTGPRMPLMAARVPVRKIYMETP